MGVLSLASKSTAEESSMEEKVWKTDEEKMLEIFTTSTAGEVYSPFLLSSALLHAALDSNIASQSFCSSWLAQECRASWCRNGKSGAGCVEPISFLYPTLLPKWSLIVLVIAARVNVSQLWYCK